MFMSVFFFNDTATTEIYTLSLHDALPISLDDLAPEKRNQLYRMLRLQVAPVSEGYEVSGAFCSAEPLQVGTRRPKGPTDRKSTRLNSSHANISYAVFCLKKNKTNVPFTSH